MRPVVVEGKSNTGAPIYTAYDPELPGCMGQGSTIKEARRALARARAEFFKTAPADVCAVGLEPFVLVRRS